MPIDLLPSVLALTFGLLAAAAPSRAALLWSGDRMRDLPPGRRVVFLRWYRVFGLMLLLAGVLLAADKLTAPRSHSRGAGPVARRMSI